LGGRDILSTILIISIWDKDLRMAISEKETNAINKKKNTTAEQKNPRKPRTNVERTAEAKEKIINAAIENIYDLGYEGTSIKLVAERAGFSKGAAQHHFPSKTELMLAVADFCLKSHNQIRYDIFNSYVPGPESLSHTAESSWEIINHPSYTALIEIMMATRNNADLKEGFKPLVAYMDERREFGKQAFLKDFDLEDNEMVDTLIRTHVTAMRGIAVGLMFNPNKKMYREEMELMQDYERLMTDFLIKKYGKKKK